MRINEIEQVRVMDDEAVCETIDEVGEPVTAEGVDSSRTILRIRNVTILLVWDGEKYAIEDTEVE